MKSIREILRGVIIGVANIIPGVSGGTMMVSMGIYDTLIGCINGRPSFPAAVTIAVMTGLAITAIASIAAVTAVFSSPRRNDPR